MRAIFFILFGGLVLAGCAGKKTVNDSWDTSPRSCDTPMVSDCTPLPQALPDNQRVEAKLMALPDGSEVQVYELIQAGADVRVIFIHGVVGHASDFRRQFSRPVAGADLIAYDRPGYGRSGPKEKDYSLAYQVRCVERLLSKEKKTTILVGHSYGGAVATQAALDYPSRVQGLVLVSAILDPAQSNVYKIQYGLDKVADLLPSALRNTNRELIELHDALSRQRLADLNIPIEAIHGGEDDIVNPSNLAYLVSRFTAAGKGKLVESRLYPEYGHRIPDINPEALNDALDRELARVRAH